MHRGPLAGTLLRQAKATSHFKNLAGSPMLALMRRTELSDKQWQHLHPLLPLLKGGGRPRADERKTLNGILYVLRTGCRWEDVPTDANGLPVGAELASAHRHEVKLAVPTLQTVWVPRA